MNKILSVCLLISICPSFVLGSCDDLNSPGQQDLTSQQQDISQEVQQNDLVITMTITEDFGKAENVSKIFGQKPNSQDIKFPDFTQDGLLVPIGQILLNYLFEKEHKGTGNDSVQYIESEAKRLLTNDMSSFEQKQDELEKLFAIFQPLQEIVDNKKQLSQHSKDNLLIKVSLNSNSGERINRVVFSKNTNQVNNFKYNNTDDSVTVNINKEQFFQNVDSLNFFISSLRKIINKWMGQGYIDERQKLLYVIDKNLTSVIINKHIVELIPGVFSNCAALQKVQFEEGSQLQTIGGSAFSGCSALKEAVIPSSVATMGNGIFSGCSALEKITLRNQITEIPENMFDNCANLSTLIINSNQEIQKIGNNAFENCKQLTQISFLNASVVGDNAFFGCEKLFNIILSGNLSSIGSYALSGTKIDRINLGQISEIPVGLFKNCAALKEVTIPGTVSHIYNKAFYGCPNLQQINIPGSVVFIGNEVFRKSGLTQIVLNNVKQTGNAILAECPNLQTFSGNNIQEISEGMCAKCPNLQTVIIPKVQEIGDCAFYQCPKLKHVVHEMNPETPSVNLSVSKIGERAFFGCSSLTSVYLPRIITLDQGIFAKCHQLSTVNIPQVKQIPELCFAGCSSLQEVIMLQAQELGRYAFFDCTNLTKIAGQNVTSIGEKCFKNCVELTTVEFPNLSEIKGPYIFGNCGIERFSMPINLTKIPYGMFYSCKSLKEIEFNKNITEIGYRAFYGCSSLFKTTEQSNQLTSGISNILTDSTFGKIISIFMIPESVAKIKSQAFTGCALKKVVFQNQHTEYFDNSFDQSTQCNGGTVQESPETKRAKQAEPDKPNNPYKAFHREAVERHFLWDEDETIKEFLDPNLQDE